MVVTLLEMFCYAYKEKKKETFLRSLEFISEITNITSILILPIKIATIIVGNICRKLTATNVAERKMKKRVRRSKKNQNVQWENRSLLEKAFSSQLYFHFGLQQISSLNLCFVVYRNM
uniref:Uncharacterized protein n=1 Tax=Onchocerca volvulus TaxID=6282 RepID=A0A8R1Y2E9_ONCVO